MARFLFSGSLLLNAVLLSLLLLVCSGPFMPGGEHWEGWAYIWLFSLPAMLMCAAACSFAYPRYRAAPSTRSRVALYLGMVGATVVAAPVLTLLVWEVLSRSGAGPT
jgi:hypothetical protein